MSAPVHPQHLPRRRAVLTVGWGAVTLLALAGSPLLTGCRSGTPAVATMPPPTPTPDEVLRRRAVTQVRTLLAAVSVPGARSTLRPVLGRLGTGYQEQLAALGEPVPTPSGSGTGTTPRVSPGTATTAVAPKAVAPTAVAPTAVAPKAVAPKAVAPKAVAPKAVAPTAAALVAVQRAATAEALTDCTFATTPGMAVLLARLAAAHAAEADLVSAAARLPLPGPVTPAPSAGGPANESASGRAASTEPGGDTGSEGAAATTPSPVAPALGPEQVTALTRLLQGEHAAIYAYGVVTAWVAPSLRDRARACWAAHLSSRDDLVRLLTAASATAPAASAGYDIGTPPDGSAAAATLAAKVEERLAALAAAAVGATADTARVAAAGVLVAAARRRAGWTTAVPALPG